MLLDFHAKRFPVSIVSPTMESDENKNENTRDFWLKQFNMFGYVQGESIQQHICRFNTLVSKLKSFGQVFVEHQLSKQLLDSLPMSWNNVRLALKDSPRFKEYTLAEVIKKIEVYDMEYKKRQMLNPSSANKSTHNPFNLTFAASSAFHTPRSHTPSPTEYNKPSNAQIQGRHSQSNVSTTAKDTTSSGKDIVTTTPVVSNSLPKVNNEMLEAYAELGQVFLSKEDVISTDEIDQAHKKFDDLYQAYRTGVPSSSLTDLCSCACCEKYAFMSKAYKRIYNENCSFRYIIKEMKENELKFKNRIKDNEAAIDYYKSGFFGNSSSVLENSNKIAELEKQLDEAKAKIADLQVK